MDKVKNFFHQGNLENVVRKLFPDQKVESNSRKKSEIINPNTGYYLELDVWIPDLNICFEFQDLYHYISTWDHQTPLYEIKKKDGLKQEAVLERGDTLVLVPFWWDGSERSLIAAIQFVRPDLFGHTPFTVDSLVALNPPESFFKYGNIPGVGPLMLASFPPLTSVFIDSISDADPWWLGEKYDGIRSCWNPSNKILYSRWGIDQQIPIEFECLFPKAFLDGEIWFGRGSFIESVKVMGSGPTSVDWPNLRFVAFDSPHPLLVGEAFELRYLALLYFIPPDHPFLIHAPRILCTHKFFLTRVTQDIIDSGGEGVILRKPSSRMVGGRTNELVKLKVTRSDVEVLVADVLGTTSKLQLPDGVIFEMEVPAEIGEGKIKRGDVVTLAYESYSSRGIPRNPKIHRIRGDVTWEQVVVDYSMKTPQSQNISETTRKIPGTYWSSDNSEREFFEKIAKRQKFDPLVAENWYSLSEPYVKRQQGSKGVLDAYEGQLSLALIANFPDIGLQENSFKYKSRIKWSEAANRRKSFIEFAEERNFDPLIASNWYTLNTSVFDRFHAILSWYYKGSYINALLHLFPEIGLKRDKFSEVPNKYWKDVNNRRAAFDEFAKKKQFDPLIPGNWYNISRSAVFDKIVKRGGLLYYYKGRLAEALVHLYPDIGLRHYRFAFMQRSYWNKRSHRRKGLEEYARDNNFDPLVPDNWYPTSLMHLRQFANMRSILSHHNDSLRQALIDLFPDIGLDPKKFRLGHIK